MMTTANRQPHRRRLSQPMPVRASASASNKNRRPADLPKGESSWYARGFKAHIRSRAVPGLIRLVPAINAIAAPNSKKTLMAVIPRGGEAKGRGVGGLIAQTINLNLFQVAGKRQNRKL